MTQRYQVYRCGVCGNMVEVTRVGRGELSCCGTPMLLLPEQSEEALAEKHRPVAETRDGTLRVKVGVVPHPMEDRHFIEWIDVVTDTGVTRKYLHPGDNPAAFFPMDAPPLKVRAHCTLHGLWKGA
ncbi:MAG: desulfoferrodoxin [Methanomicrobiales archaeon]|nr:desulfoferrodoxin [Methanomicrobiales archaeon]MDD1659744.1 desulfoferrodoxin [Methanomicrobiales archaeon]